MTARMRLHLLSLAVLLFVLMVWCDRVTVAAKKEEGEVPDLMSVLKSISSSPPQSSDAELDLSSPISLDDLSPSSLSLLESSASDHADSLAAELLEETHQIVKQLKNRKGSKKMMQPSNPPTAAASTSTTTTPPPSNPPPSSPPSFHVGDLQGAPKSGGVDIWYLRNARGVYNQPFGHVIGSIPPDTKVAVSLYQHNKTKDDNVQWGYGFITGANSTFGGWLGPNACGWFPIQRIVELKGADEEKYFGSLEKSEPDQAVICPQPARGKEFVALASKIFKVGTFLNTPTHPIAAGTTKDCNVYTNYDPLQGKPASVGPYLVKGVASGKGARGVVPSIIATPSKTVEDFGVQFVTKDGKYASVYYPRLDPQNPGFKYFYLSCDCIEFDTTVANALNSLSLIEAKSSTQLEEGDEEMNKLDAERAELEEERSEFADQDFSAVETASEARVVQHSQHHRGNYPGWTPSIALLEIEQQQQQQPLNQPPQHQKQAASTHHDSHPDIKRVFLPQGQTHAKVPTTAGIDKIHVHLYGKEDINVDKAQRLKNVVNRLANNQKKSYDKIGELLTKLQKCSDLSDSSACIKRVTAALQEQRDQFTPQ